MVEFCNVCKGTKKDKSGKLCKSCLQKTVDNKSDLMKHFADFDLKK